jgi:hypothetical protein
MFGYWFVVVVESDRGPGRYEQGTWPTPTISKQYLELCLSDDQRPTWTWGVEKEIRLERDCQPRGRGVAYVGGKQSTEHRTQNVTARFCTV